MKLKKVIVPFFVLSTTAITSFSNLFNKVDNVSLEVSATQHISNFDNYTYSGVYYSKITSMLTDGENGTLRSTLTTLIHPTTTPTYSGTGSGTLCEVYQKSEEDPTNSSNMIYFYTRDSVTKNNASSWNREHVWPQSLSNGNWGTQKGGAGADILHIRPTYNSTNSSRGNSKFGNISGTALTYNGMTYGYSSGSYFAPLDATKGDAARIIMYIWTAYFNQYKSKPLSITSVFDSYETMLKWHIADKPDLLEGKRNDAALVSVQKNRNPFVDHPEYACHIFGDKVSTATKNLCYQTYSDVPNDGGDNNEPESNDKFPTWAIVTIAVGSGTFVLGSATAITIFLLKRKRKIM